MKKRALSVLLIICMLISSTAAFADIKKDETVYVKLQYDGSIEEIRVVNHIYGSEATETYKDYGSYTEIKNMTDNKMPDIKGDEVIWPMNLLKSKDVYYQGKLDKPLPVAVSIKYFLDGKELDPNILGGKNGHLRIDIAVKYDEDIDWGATNLTTQIQLAADMDVFSNIKSNGSSVVVGKKNTTAFVSLPPSAQSFTFEADGENIYLEPISITIVPSSFELPEGIESGIKELTEGLDKLDAGSGKLVKGAEELTAGTDRLKSGMTELDEGVSKLYSGTQELNKSSQGLSKGMEEYYKGINQLSGGLEQFAAGHSQLMQLAAMYINSEDPMLRKMAEGVMQEGEALQKLNAGLKESSIGFEGLKQGAERYFAGVGEINGALGIMKQNTRALPGSIDKLSGGQAEMKKGIVSLNRGIKEMSKGIKGNLSGSLLGERKNNYTSFADNQRNKNSTVQFVMRTPSVDRPEQANTVVKAVPEKKSFWDRLLDLFRRK